MNRVTLITGGGRSGMARQFQDLAGQVNQETAALADCVILMSAGYLSW